jgi:hypothetical protein
LCVGGWRKCRRCRQRQLSDEFYNRHVEIRRLGVPSETRRITPAE